MTEDAWIQQLAVGDLVFVTQSYGLPSRPDRVTRLTPTQVLVGDNGRRFRRIDGRAVGMESLDTHFILEPTQDRRDKWEVYRLRSMAADLRKNMEIPSTKEKLMAFIDAMKPWVKSEDKTDRRAWK